MKIVSVLTPVLAHGRAAEFIADLYESIRSQNLPSGWALEWLVQEDGFNPLLADVVRQVVGDDPRVFYGAHLTQGGPALARNQAFHASQGEVVFSVDHDDCLVPDGLAALVNAFEAHPAAAWATGRTYEVDEYGVRTERHNHVGPGQVAAGHTLLIWNTEGVSTPWYPTATAYRRWALSLFGGWPANVVGEDTELLACVTAAWDGVVVEEYTMVRRIWSGQLTKDPVVVAAAADARRVRHARATMIDVWRAGRHIGSPQTG